jgi:hypothetical protein
MDRLFIVLLTILMLLVMFGVLGLKQESSYKPVDYTYTDRVEMQILVDACLAKHHLCE